MYPSRDRLAANRSSLAYVLASYLVTSCSRIITGLDSHLCVPIDLSEVSKLVLESDMSEEKFVRAFSRPGASFFEGSL